MKLLPSILFRESTSAGESRVHDLLVSSFASEPGIAFHSLNLPDHAYKLYGEADFVLVRPRCVLVLEVKGGVVVCQNGSWSFENGRGQSRKKSEAPYRQAQSAMWAVEKLIRDAAGAVSPLLGYAVAFPFTDWPRGQVPELPDVLVLDRGDCVSTERFEARILEIESFWIERGRSSGRAAHVVDVEAYADAIRPSFHAFESLASSSTSVLSRSAHLTLDQIRVLDAIHANPRILLEGPAGTGKTLLCAAWAKAAIRNGDRTLIVAPTPGLRLLFKHACPGAVVSSREELELSAAAARFDCAIVDEGQCFIDAGFLALLDGSLKGGLRHGCWRWGMDPINQLDKAISADAMATLRENATACRLTRNIRSARPIVDQVRVILGADLDVERGIAHGVAPRFDDVASSKLCTSALNTVTEWLEAGVAAADITVIAAERMRGELASQIPLARTDISFGDRSQGVLITDVASFRGLESPWLLVVLDDVAPDGIPLDRWLYIAMTRARAGLAMLIGDGARHQLEKLESRNFFNLM